MFRSQQRLSSECFAEKECMNKCGFITSKCSQEKECKVDYERKCDEVEEQERTYVYDLKILDNILTICRSVKLSQNKSVNLILRRFVIQVNL